MTSPNSLTSKESYDLRAYIYNNAPEGKTLDELRKLAEEHTGFAVTYANVRSACADVGYEFMKKRKPSAGKRDRARVIATELLAVMSQLGIKPSQELLDIQRAK